MAASVTAAGSRTRTLPGRKRRGLSRLLDGSVSERAEQWTGERLGGLDPADWLVLDRMADPGWGFGHLVVGHGRVYAIATRRAPDDGVPPRSWSRWRSAAKQGAVGVRDHLEANGLLQDVVPVVAVWGNHGLGAEGHQRDGEVWTVSGDALSVWIEQMRWSVSGLDLEATSAR